MEHQKKLSQYPLVWISAGLLAVLTVADCFANSRKYSELENRTLRQRPAFTVESLLRNEYTQWYEAYINDQFVGRDRWITAKSVCESLLGKIENNGVTYGKDHYLFGKVTDFNQNQLKRNLGFVEEFAEICGQEVTLSIIPNSYAILTELLPVGQSEIQINQRALIAGVEEQAEKFCTVLPLVEVMQQAAATGEQIYYRNDHHWTTGGAWYAYAAFLQSRGRTPVSREEMKPYLRQTSNFLGTYFNKAKKFDALPDSIVWYDFPCDVTINGGTSIPDGLGGEIEVKGLYQMEQFQARDQYAAFLYGNNGLTVIRNLLRQPSDNPSRILLIKDSYGNCLAPYLSYSYDEVYVVDLRGYPGKLRDLVAETPFDDIWILYNFENFESDKNLVRMIF